MVLLDSDLVIEAQRAQPKAVEWLESLAGPMALPAAVAWELLFGSRDKHELLRAQKFLDNFDVEPLTAEDSALTQRLMVDHVLSGGLSLPDFLIAAQALNRNATLFTFNLRHFQTIPGLDSQMPYQR